MPLLVVPVVALVVVPVMVTVAVLVMVPMVMLVVVMLVVLVTMVECSVCFASPMLPELLRHVRHPHVDENVMCCKLMRTARRKRTRRIPMSHVCVR